MFIAVYEFEIKEGLESRFRQAWLEVTKEIYRRCGSFGSRLHTSDRPNRLVAYAQWPSRDRWEADRELTDPAGLEAQGRMRDCLVQSRTVYRLEVCDDYLQSSPAAGRGEGAP